MHVVPEEVLCLLCRGWLRKHGTNWAWLDQNRVLACVGTLHVDNTNSLVLSATPRWHQRFHEEWRFIKGWENVRIKSATHLPFLRDRDIRGALGTVSSLDNGVWSSEMAEGGCQLGESCETLQRALEADGTLPCLVTDLISASLICTMTWRLTRPGSDPVPASPLYSSMTTRPFEELRAEELDHFVNPHWVTCSVERVQRVAVASNFCLRRACLCGVCGAVTA